MKKKSSSWEGSHDWYDKIVGGEGHYYHQHVIFPRLLKMMKGATSVLDLGCGQGVLARHLPQEIPYIGIDLSPSLIKAASHYNKNKLHRLITGDVTKPLAIKERDFSHVVVILALQNIAEGSAVLKQAKQHLAPQGKLILVLNHPCFRIPRQTSWQVDAAKKIQYRRVDRYLSSLEIPIQIHPGDKPAEMAMTYHHPLSTYSQWLRDAGLAIWSLEEWCSDKVSEGGAARMENRAREEFPLFLMLEARPV